MRKHLKMTALFFMLCAATASAQYDVPYVPTDYAVVDTMLSVAGVNKSDTLYDLGCGDGRIVVAAAKIGVAKAIGIDINPVRIQESKANAEKAGVTNKVEFREADIFKSDYKDATVITMYLLYTVNLRLRPTFFQVLKPGTRLVSHDFNMGDWTADRVITVLGSDGWGNHMVYYWVIPANASGDWTFTAGNLPHALHIVQKYQKVSGTMEVNGTKSDIADMTITGAALQFSVKASDGTVYRYNGMVNGNAITGTIVSGQTTTKWEAARDPKTTQVIVSQDASGELE